MPWLLLPYATTTQALSATTAQVIHGTAPYLTFDNGVTKVTTTEGLLGIKLSNGTRFTPATNTSTATNPIVLPVANQSFADIDMLVPPTTDSIALRTLISAPNNYWGDDDGDGQGTNGITASGDLSVRITDKNGQAVSRNTVLSLCGEAPYKVELTSTAGSLTTQYGLPNSSSFSGGTATYYISPKPSTPICVRYARPNLKYGSSREPDYWGNRPMPNFAGPGWDSGKGFLVQSTTPSGYNRNFPTTGANNLYFDLLVDNGGTLTWPTVTKGGITATMTLNPPVDSNFNPDGASSVRVTLTGPNSSAVSTPRLPQTFEIVGYDSNNNAVVKYGFVLNQWFIVISQRWDYYANLISKCSSIGGHLPRQRDLSNAVCRSGDYCPSAGGGTPPSTGNNYQRNIGAGFFAEWGRMGGYTGAGFQNMDYATSERLYWDGGPGHYTNNPMQVSASSGMFHNSGEDVDDFFLGACVYP